jgi:hypothetical protein
VQHGKCSDLNMAVSCFSATRPEPLNTEKVFFRRVYLDLRGETANFFLVLSFRLEIP